MKGPGFVVFFENFRLFSFNFFKQNGLFSSEFKKKSKFGHNNIIEFYFEALITS
jgi:hypothetical protein